jgi:uncharacterized protein YjbI with pentapeptide repeats
MDTSMKLNAYLSVLTPEERQTSLIGAWFTAQRLRGVDLSNCVFEKTHCDDTTFEEVNFQRGNFRGAYLRRARFVRCDLTDAVFPGALVAGAEFVACRGLTADTIHVLRRRGAQVAWMPPESSENG